MGQFRDRQYLINYVEKGAGESLFLLPGNTVSSRMHEKDVEFWSANYRVICPDYIGYGKSSRGHKLPTNFWQENAVVLSKLAESLDFRGYSIVGTSGGAIIGLNMAIIDRNNVKAVVADSFAGEHLTIEEAEKIKQERLHITKEQCLFWEHAHGNDWSRVIENDTNMLTDMAATGESCFAGSLGEIACPVLFTGSLEDNLISNISEKMLRVASKIPSAKSIFYSSGDHPIMWSRANEFRDDAMNFLSPSIILPKRLTSLPL